jgi:cytoskeletal protein CcmA (bactofilin family)
MAKALAAVQSAPSDSSESVLGRGTRVRGRVQGDGDLRIEGQVEGNVSVSGELSLEEGATITGDVEAAAVTISGALTGDVTAQGPVAIRVGARVTGNLGGTEVSLEEGAEFFGRIEAEFELPDELTGGRHGGR